VAAWYVTIEDSVTSKIKPPSRDQLVIAWWKSSLGYIHTSSRQL